MSFRKEQEAARARAAEPINLGMGRVSYASASDAFGADTVHRMFEEHRARQSGATATGETLYEDMRRFWQWNGPGHGWSTTPPYNWKEDPDCTDPFRVLPDGTIDLHPSQWSVIA